MYKETVNFWATIVLVVLSLILIGFAMWTKSPPVILVCAFLSGWFMRSARCEE